MSVDLLWEITPIFSIRSISFLVLSNKEKGTSLGTFKAKGYGNSFNFISYFLLSSPKPSNNLGY
jgi:hypothetical protein